MSVCLQDLIADEELLEPDAPAPAPPPPAFPAGTFRPGRVVWAKVEGHEWWPAKVVRRRAVPRDVAEPPGGKTFVKYFIPVIFFTAQGIPGDARSFKDRLDAALAASGHTGRKFMTQEKPSTKACLASRHVQSKQSLHCVVCECMGRVLLLQRFIIGNVITAAA